MNLKLPLCTTTAIILLSLIACKDNIQSANENDEENIIVGTWERYEFYRVAYKSDGSVCSNSGSASSGVPITFKADGTYTGDAWGIGTWNYDTSTRQLTRTYSYEDGAHETEVIFLNNPQIPNSSVEVEGG